MTLRLLTYAKNLALSAVWSLFFLPSLLLSAVSRIDGYTLWLVYLVVCVTITKAVG